MNKQDILQTLKLQQKEYLDRFGVSFIGLFGSFARDEARNDSDIDILYKVEKDKKLSMFSYLKLLSELENSFKRKVDLVRDETIKPQIKKYIYQDLTYV